MRCRSAQGRSCPTCQSPPLSCPPLACCCPSSVVPFSHASLQAQARTQLCRHCLVLPRPPPHPFTMHSCAWQEPGVAGSQSVQSPRSGGKRPTHSAAHRQKRRNLGSKWAGRGWDAQRDQYSKLLPLSKIAYPSIPEKVVSHPPTKFARAESPMRQDWRWLQPLTIQSKM